MSRDAESCSGLVRLNAHTSGNWRREQRAYGGRAGRQREFKPLTPPPGLTSHPKASGKGKSMGFLSARDLWLEFDPCRVFTDLEMDRSK